MQFKVIVEYLNFIEKFILVKQYEKFIVAYSENNNPIYLYKIYNMPNQCLFLGFPHPNEPFSQIFIEMLFKNINKYQGNKEWYVVPVWDIDGALINEKWWKNKTITINNMIDNWYRPATNMQVEWTFPIVYKGYFYNNPMPETLAVKKILDDVKFDFLISLHNSMFADSYFYISDNLKEHSGFFNKLLSKNEFDIINYKPTPYVDKIEHGIFNLPYAKKEIEYFMANNSMENYDNGQASFEYVNSNCKCIIPEISIFDLELTKVTITKEYIQCKKKYFWEGMHNILSSVFDNLSEEVNKSISSPHEFFKKREIDTIIIFKDKIKKELLEDIADNGECKRYISFLFVIATQITQIKHFLEEKDKKFIREIKVEIGNLVQNIKIKDYQKLTSFSEEIISFLGKA